MSCYIVQEVDGSSRFTLEDGSGFLVLEDCIPIPPSGNDQNVMGGRQGDPGILMRRRHEEEDLLAVILGEM